MSNNFSFNIYADSITGRRPKNEDSYLYVTNDYGQTLIVVCDGIGSEYHSEVASQLSTKIFEKNFVEEKKIKNFKKYYFNCVEEISKVIAEFSIQKIDGKKIGTTVVVCLLEGDTIQGA
jgi:serine/threonine protein phosphatase PrpC